MRYAFFPGAFVMLFCCAHAAPALSGPLAAGSHSGARPPAASPSPAPPPIDPALIYSRHSRRLVQSYLRLKLGEVREADLDRARLVIEHKLGIGTLLGETPPPARR